MSNDASVASPTPRRGWYTDPNDAASHRYWDGHDWTENRAPVALRPEKETEFTALQGVGYALAVITPLIGCIIGLTQVNRNIHGWRIVTLSVVAFLLWVAISVAVAGDRGGGR